MTKCTKKTKFCASATKIPKLTKISKFFRALDKNYSYEKMQMRSRETLDETAKITKTTVIGRYLIYDDRKSIVQVVIMSRIDYCNSLLVGVPSTQLSKLQRLQNAAARLVSNVAKYDHITPTLVNLHWLPVTYRVNFKIAMLAHKCIYGNAPEYLKDLIKVKSTTRYNLRSDGEMLLEDYSARSKKTLGDRTFKVAAPRIWNILPKDIRKQDNYYISFVLT